MLKKACTLRIAIVIFLAAIYPTEDITHNSMHETQRSEQDLYCSALAKFLICNPNEIADCVVFLLS